MKSYRLLVDLEAIDYVNTLSLRDRRALRKCFLALKELPDRQSDFQERDATGRTVDIHLCGRFAVKYWIDFADRHVKVLAVESAD